MEAWHDLLFDRMYEPTPSGASPLSLSRLAEADRELWRLLIDRCRPSVRPGADGKCPMDAGIESFMYDSRVSFYLLPAHRPVRDEPASRAQPNAPNHGKGGGKSKNKEGLKQSVPRMPAGLVGQRFRDVSNKPICFNYNLEGCSHQGPQCDRGAHSCAGCGQAGHPLSECPKRRKVASGSAAGSASASVPKQG
eukprot:1724309-Amphidinium_carterae.1